MSDNIVHLNDNDFDDLVLQKQRSVLVDFWAAWCGPCQMIAPVLQEIAADEKYMGKLTVAKLDVDANKDIPARYGIRSIPALLLFINGEHVATKVGAVSQSQLEEFLNNNLQ
jgi:thioredoxin 1